MKVLIIIAMSLAVGNALLGGGAETLPSYGAHCDPVEFTCRH